MNRIIVTLLLVFIGLLSYAQVLTFTQDTFSISKSASTSFELVAEGNTVNNSSNQIVIWWQRVVDSHDVSWTGTQVCDGILGYPSNFSGPPIPDTIAANSMGNMDVHFINDFLPGQGEVHVKAWIDGDSANSAVTAVFLGRGLGTTVSAPTLNRYDNVKVYPNPANDFVMVKNLPENQVAKIEVYNILGKRMVAFHANMLNGNSGPQRFGVAQLPKGIYMVRIYDQFMNVVTTKSITKE